MDDFPKPRVPKQPVLSWASFSGYEGEHVASILDVGQAVLVTSGRIAIAIALQQSGLGQGDKVLLPAYHCTSMVEPVIWVGATPLFYRITEDLQADLEDVEAKLDKSAKALLITHYFGFHQDLAKLREFCDARGIFLIEDCAHAFFGEFRGAPLGSYGDYAISSLMKFFPVYDGGCIVSSRHDLSHVPLESAGFGFEVKAALDVIETAFQYERLKALKVLVRAPLMLKDLAWRKVKAAALSGKQNKLAPSSSDGGSGFEPAWLNKRMSAFSRLLVSSTSKAGNVEKRRENYLALLQALNGLHGARPLFPTLPKGVVPYVFPLVVGEPERVFPLLKAEGVPVIRFGEFLWEGVDESVCPVSADLSRRVFQFPCHQELTTQELNWMITKIRCRFPAANAAFSV